MTLPPGIDGQALAELGRRGHSLVLVSLVDFETDRYHYQQLNDQYATGALTWCPVAFVRFEALNTQSKKPKSTNIYQSIALYIDPHP